MSSKGFFPGFTARTGGLLRERDLIGRRDAFQADRATRDAFWRSLVGAAAPDGALKVSLFGYSGARYEALLEAMKHHGAPVWVVAPEGVAATAVTDWLRGKAHGERGAVEAFTVPFLDQDRYDELLWACDLNFVRGEDSFVRAQWAARPFVWNIYPQDDGAHVANLAQGFGGSSGHIVKGGDKRLDGAGIPDFAERLSCVSVHHPFLAVRQHLDQPFYIAPGF